ncbi:MAG: PAS domain-containing protein [Deltaproteobacteria bacterium]|nr:PAS domain-containing protein [Deltaproteobacteria bacterium]
MVAPPADLKAWLQERLFEAFPSCIAVIDRQFNVVYANEAFETVFGEWRQQKCYSVYKDRDSECRRCDALKAFEDGERRMSEEVGYDRHRRLASYFKYTVPMKDDDGQVRYLVEMSIDASDMERLRQEHRLLFEKVPCNVAVLDSDLRIVRANESLREKFGAVEGRFCYEVLKGLVERCAECPAQQTFEDGLMHTGRSVLNNRKGQAVHLQVTTAALEVVDGRVERVLEIAADVTKTLRLEDQLRVAHSFLENLVRASPDGTIAIDAEGDVTIFNPAARAIVRASEQRSISSSELSSMLPQGFLSQVIAGPGRVYIPESEIVALDGERVPVRLTGIEVRAGERAIGVAIFLQDLRPIRQLEREKLDAERLAAVGQTVAGLAHGVKNLITGLEGGMYMLETGLTKSNSKRIEQGWDMLKRNISRISVFVKDFLSFSKGRVAHVSPCVPGEIAQEVVDLYAGRAQALGIELLHQEPVPVEPAALDREGIHECLTNLVGNAIDACEMNDNAGVCHVLVRTLEKDNTVMYEVVDNGCGMDYDVKRKAFTTFFTTKGLGGTGLGLLTTRRIVQEHGGRITVESEVGKGTTFRVLLPRGRLPGPGDHGDV